MIVVLAGVWLSWHCLQRQAWANGLIFLGCAAGTIGSLVSTLQRVQSLEYRRFMSWFHIAWQGFTRVVLGMTFGGIAVVAMQADLLLGAFKQDMFAIFVAAMAAGFSERLIPDLLTRVSQDSETEKPDPPK